METHVSSTTADVPEMQAVISSHGNVELVIVVEKLDDEQPHTADSNSQDNAQPAIQKNKAIIGNHSTKNNSVPRTSPLKKEPSQGAVDKQVDLGKTVETNKIEQTKQLAMVMPNKSDIKTLNISPEKKDNELAQDIPVKECLPQADVDSTSVKDNHALVMSNVTEKDLIVTVERETSNDSQIEMSSDMSDKEHNKSISRELKSLINSAKESKIISECTKLTSKTRKSRSALDTSNTILSNSTEADSIQGNRRNSSNSQKSNCSDRSEKMGKRSMRSQNPEFVHKVKKFLNSVTGKFHKGGDSDASSSDEEMVDKSKEDHTDSSPSTPKNSHLNLNQSSSIMEDKSNKLRSDPYCWRCHWPIDMADGEKVPQPPLRCTVCPRSFHYRCLTSPERTKCISEKNWVCAECLTVLHAESSETRSTAMKKTSLGMLCQLLKFALQRMTEINGVEPFMQPVDRAVFPDYDKYVVHPMDLSLMKEHIAERLYGSTEAFLGDAHWILHNSIIFNTLQSKLTAAARALVRSCRAEMCEVEACPECYAAAHARRPTWFTDVCSTPHLLLWAKLKGFPYWPAKAMSVTQAGMVDVRFFGAHDRAWVPARDCFLYSEKDPNHFRTKRQDIIDSMQEAEQHIRNISRKYGKFVYATFRVQFEPSKLEEQLKTMIPSFEGPVKSPIRDKRPRTPALVKKSRSNSKGSKDGLNLGDATSDREVSPVNTSAVSEGAEKMEEGSPVKKTHGVFTRKRQRSESKEAATPDTSFKKKSKRLGGEGKEQESKKQESPLISCRKDIPQKVKRNKDEVDKPPERQSPKLSASGSTPTILAITSKINKETPKIITDKNKDDKLQPNKTPAGNDTLKNNETGKQTAQDVKPVLQNVRSSRSNKSLNTTSPMEVEQSSADSPSTTKLENNAPSKTNTIVNKNDAKEADSLNKSNTKGNTSEPAVLNTEKGNKTSTFLPNEINGNEIINGVSAHNNATEKEKSTVFKNKSKEKQSVTAIIDINNGKGKLSDTGTPNKDSSNEKKTSNLTASNKRSGDEKFNEFQTHNIQNSGNEKSSETAIPSKNAEKVKAPEISPMVKTVSIAKLTESNQACIKNTNDKVKSITVKDIFTPKAGCSKTLKPTKDRIQFDEDSRAVLANRKSSASPSSLPTISSVRSLSGAPPAPAAPRASKANTTQITIEVNPDSSIFTPTSTDNVRNMKEAVNKLKNLRSGLEPPQVGRVGVRAFARMTSPLEKANTNDVLVEIKAEPVDIDESVTPPDTSIVPGSLRTRPTFPPAPTATLREVRINKVMAGPAVAKKVMKPPDVRPRAKKTFPQPKKADDGRVELTSKNSMVYIPIQPPVSQAPARGTLKPAPSLPAPRAPLMPTSVNVGMTSMAPPLLPMGPPPPPAVALPATSAAAVSTIPASGGVVVGSAGPTASHGTVTAAAIIGGPTFPTVPTTVHTVPLITSVNGQWTFSLQPVMSVGGVDSITSPMVNGVVERSATTATTATPVPSPMPTVPPALVPTSTNSSAVAPNRTSDAAMGEPPRLQQRPPLNSPLAASTPVGEVPTPSAAGPLTAKLNQNSVKLADFFRTLLEDSLDRLEEPEAQVTALRLQLEQARWKYQHELAELRHTHELLLVEARTAMEKEKARAVVEVRRLAHQELDAAVKHAKSKQWCANCSQEAQFYCCWNTSYCDYPCQRAHWAQHYGSCTQQRAAGASGADARPDSDHTLPTSTEDVTKTTSAPTLTVGGKVTSRAVNPDQQKSPIVVSASGDANAAGVGAGAGAGPQAGTLHAAPLLANKQLMSNEDCGSKRLVTSGGYLIVGAASAVAPPRAPQRPD